jgi:FSR family fosmidomycin resistance protein-like MFS transporter
MSTPAALQAPAVTVRRRFLDLHPAILLMASTHFVVDAYGNIYAPLLPLLIPRLGLSLTMVGTLAMVFQFATSVSQLGFGALADRWRPRRLVLTGPLVIVVMLSFIGWAWSPLTLGIVLVAGGLGSAMFHPPAAALVHAVSDHRKGFAMAVHITGGSLGFSVSPLVFAPIIATMGLGWSPIIALPGLLALSFTLRRVPPIEPPPRGTAGGFRRLRPYARPLTLLYLIVVLRTLTSVGLATFMPVLLTRHGMSVAEASAAVSVYLFLSGIGGFLGGPLADRYGPRRVILWSLLAAVPFLVAGPLATGWTLTALLSIGGFLLQSTLPVNVTFGQAIAPVSAATVSSLMMGFAWGTGGAMVPLVGMLADRAGLPVALAFLGLVPLAAALCVRPLPATAPPPAMPAVVPPVPGDRV